MNFDLGGCHVFNSPNFQFSFLHGFGYRFLQRAGGFGEWNFANYECFAIQFFDFRSHFECSAPCAVVISGNVDASACGEVGKDFELFAAKIFHGRVANFVQIVG